jgi:citrate synthase
MHMNGKPVAGGLEGVVVAETQLSHVDGDAGRLVIAGGDVEELAGRVRFEEMCFRLWKPHLPDLSAEEVGPALAAGRAWAYQHLRTADSALRLGDGMEALRAALALVPATGGALELNARLTGATATFAAAWARLRHGAAPLPPAPSASHAADLLGMATGEQDAAKAAALEAYLVTVSDHGMNASTFTARVIASTGSDAVSAAVGAVGALKGPLHGGAPGPVLDMLDGIGSPERAEAWLEQELLAGRRIMGMGHRIYRVRDPRAAVLERAVEALERAGVSTPRLGLARAVERAAETALRARHPERPLRANVEFYTAVLLDSIGMPRTLFSSLFACGRMAGWLGHIAEQRATGRLIRPDSRYVGALPGTEPALAAASH